MTEIRSKLFGRVIRVVIGDVDAHDLRMRFRVMRTSESGTAAQSDLVIYNLSEETRKKLTTQVNKIEITAGYQENSSLIFRGKTNQIIHGVDGPDWITQIRAGDGAFELANTRLNQTFKPGQTVNEMVKQLAQKFGLNLPKSSIDLIQQGKLKEGLTKFAHGVTLYGQARTRFDELLRAMDLEWDVQNESIQVVKLSKSLADEVVTLSPSTGLIGSPEIADKGRVRAVSLLQPKLVPFRKVTLDTLGVKGDYRVEKVTHVGDTHNNTWYSELEMVRTDGA